MKQMQRDPHAVAKARKAEQRADEKAGLISFKPVKLEGTGTGGGFKKGGFKSAFKIVGDGKTNAGKSENEEKRGGTEREEKEKRQDVELEMESETDDEDEIYDPRRPTD